VWDGIERVRVPVDGPVRDLRPGLHAAQINSLHLFGEQVCHVYPWPSGSEASMATGASALSENVQLPCSMSGLAVLQQLRAFVPETLVILISIAADD
jgi:hypothetical protein